MLKVWGLFAVVLGFFAQLSAANAHEDGAPMPPDEIVETTVAAVYADPLKFHNKIIRIRGAMDYCWGYHCLICEPNQTELPIDQRACLATSFTSPHRWSGRYLEEMYRFAEITAQGIFDARCMIRYDPETSDGQPDENGDSEIYICTDRGTVFSVSDVLEVHKRWPPNATVRRQGDKLVNATPQETKRLKNAFLNSISISAQDDFLPEDIIFRAFTFEQGWLPTHDDNPAITQDAALCYRTSWEELSEEEWPRTSFEALLPVVRKPFSCHRAEKAFGRWRFPLDQ